MTDAYIIGCCLFSIYGPLTQLLDIYTNRALSANKIELEI